MIVSCIKMSFIDWLHYIDRKNVDSPYWYFENQMMKFKNMEPITYTFIAHNEI